MKKNPVVLPVFLMYMYIILTFSSYAYAAMSDSDREFLQLCISGTAQEVERAIRNGANVHARSGDDSTALKLAAGINPNVGVINVLLQNGLDVNHKSENGQTALIAAASLNSNPEILKFLINNGADVNAKDESGWTALLAAATLNTNPEIISTLLHFGADANAEIGRSRALDYARKNPSLKGTQAYRELKRATSFSDIQIEIMVSAGGLLGSAALFFAVGPLMKKIESWYLKK